jgi:putative transposase
MFCPTAWLGWEEDLLAKMGITVTHETIRQWGRKFGPEYARKLKRRQGQLGDVWHLDEVFVEIVGERRYLWRAVDQDVDVINLLVQKYRNARAAHRFFRKVLKGQWSTPWRLVTDKLRSYGAAHRGVMPSVNHDRERYANYPDEVSDQRTRQRERQMRRFKSVGSAQRFLSVHGVILNLFNLGRHQLSSASYRLLRDRSFKEWNAATAA